MLRSFVCAMLAFGFATAIGHAEPPRRVSPPPARVGDAKKDGDNANKVTRGFIKAVDTDAGTITVALGKGDDAKSTDFKIGDAKILAGNKAVKLADLKDGSQIIVVTAADSKTVKQVLVPQEEKKKEEKK